MNWAHTHLVLNHIPILGSALLTVMIALSLHREDRFLAKLTFIAMIVIGLFALAAYFTGEPAEEVVEHLPGVSEHYIEEHEGSAGFALIATEVLALSGIAGLYMLWKKSAFLFPVLRILALISVINLALMTWTAILGGRIRHTEIRGVLATDL